VRAAALLIAALALPLRGAEIAPIAQKVAPGIPGVGVLVLGEGGDQSWKAQLDLIRKTLGKTPVAFAGGDADAGAIQSAIAELEASPAKVHKIVAVPLYVSSFSDTLDEDRYLLGIRETPSRALTGMAHAHFGAPKRAKTKFPVVMTKAFDDHPIFVGMLAARALRQTKDPAKDALLLVGVAPASTSTTREWLDGVAALAEKVRQKGGFAASRAAALSEGYGADRRDESEKNLRKLVMDLRHQGRVVALSLEPSEPFDHSKVAAALDGLFVKMDARGLFPDQAIADWVAASAQDGARLPDMRNYRDESAFGKGHANFPPLGGY